MTPKELSKIKPWSSVLHKTEAERLACRICAFMDSWEDQMTWDRYYETMTPHDKQVSHLVEKDFHKVIPYLKNQDAASLFSNSWKEAILNKMK